MTTIEFDSLKHGQLLCTHDTTNAEGVRWGLFVARGLYPRIKLVRCTLQPNGIVNRDAIRWNSVWDEDSQDWFTSIWDAAPAVYDKLLRTQAYLHESLRVNAMALAYIRGMLATNTTTVSTPTTTRRLTLRQEPTTSGQAAKEV